MTNLFDLPDDEYEAALDKYLPLDRRFTASSVNCFIMKICDFLNGMALSAEKGVIEIEKKMREAEIKLRFLECQLELIELPPDFKANNGNKTESVSAEADQEQPSTSQASVPPPPPPPLPPSLQAVAIPTASEVQKPEDVQKIEKQEEEVKIPTQQNSGGVLIKDDPQYSKYFKMLKMGVLEQAVKQKMQSEGVDPSFLNRGEEPSPNVQKTNADSSDSDSVSSFSDSD